MRLFDTHAHITDERFDEDREAVIQRLTEAGTLVAQRQASGATPRLYKDYRELLEKESLDVCLVGTPDHWHALPMIAACEAGCDVYVQKPISVDVVEAKAMLNAARKDLVEQLSAQRVAGRPRHERVDKLAGAAAGEEVSAAAREGASSAVCEESGACADALTFPKRKPYLTASVVTQEQFDACKECGINEVFFRNVVPRNGANYQALDKRFELGGEDERPEGPNLLIGGMGGIMRYRGKLPFVTDYSLNVTNSVSCREMHRLSAKRVTLSYEINEWQLGELLEAYRARNGGLPALEMIVYGHAPLLVTKYCPLKKMGQCGRCRTRQYEIRDEFGNFPILPLENCDTVVLNGKRLNLLDAMPDIDGVEAFRLAFTTESADEVRRVIALAQGKLDGSIDESVFDAETDTRGYFNKEIL